MIDVEGERTGVLTELDEKQKKIGQSAFKLAENGVGSHDTIHRPRPRFRAPFSGFVDSLGESIQLVKRAGFG
jgi:hypothetical protein